MRLYLGVTDVDWYSVLATYPYPLFSAPLLPPQARF